MPRRLLFVAVALFVAFAPTPGWAAESPITTVHYSAAADARGIAESDVNALAEHEGVTLAEARYRIELESLAADLEPLVVSRWPDTFAGLWLRTDGPPGIVIAFTERAEANLAALAADFARPEALSVVHVERSLSDLVALQERMRLDRTAIQSGTAGLIPWPIASTDGLYDLGIDVTTNQVVVYVEEPAQALLDLFVQQYGDAIRLEAGVTQPACQRHDCRYTMRGGLWLTRPNFQQLCTASFTAFTSTAYYTLSAGHCSRDTGEYRRYHGGINLGTVNLRQTQNRVDAERILRENPIWFMSASIFVESNDIRPIYHHISWDSTAINTFVGKTGMATGTTRGYITDKYISPGWITNNPERFIRVDACADNGDSGAPVFRNNTAYGIVSGASIIGCPNGIFVYGNILYAMQTLQVSLLSA